MDPKAIFEGWTKFLHISDLPAFGKLLSELDITQAGDIQMNLVLHTPDRDTTQTIFFMGADAYSLEPDKLDYAEADFINGLRGKELANV